MTKLSSSFESWNPTTDFKPLKILCSMKIGPTPLQVISSMYWSERNGLSVPISILSRTIMYSSALYSCCERMIRPSASSRCPVVCGFAGAPISEVRNAVIRTLRSFDFPPASSDSSITSPGCWMYTSCRMKFLSTSIRACSVTGSSSRASIISISLSSITGRTSLTEWRNDGSIGMYQFRTSFGSGKIWTNVVSFTG